MQKVFLKKCYPHLVQKNIVTKKVLYDNLINNVTTFFVTLITKCIWSSVVTFKK